MDQSLFTPAHLPTNHHHHPDDAAQLRESGESFPIKPQDFILMLGRDWAQWNIIYGILFQFSATEQFVMEH